MGRCGAEVCPIAAPNENIKLNETDLRAARRNLLHEIHCRTTNVYQLKLCSLPQDGMMEPSNEQARRWKLSEVLRWVCILPAAVIAGIVTQFIIGGVVQIASYGRWDNVGDSSIAYWFMVFLNYVPRRFAFVFVGATMSPRYQRTIAVGLAVLGIFLSLTIHVVGQHIAGNRVGLINYIHLIAESAGALGGTAFIFFRDWTKRRTGRAA
jgi:hypothetical protein